MAKNHARALLIGCDFYLGDGSRHLFGAVQDVNSVERFLVKTGVPRDSIIRLTSSHGDTESRAPLEDESSWPTHANIVKSLVDITEGSSPGTLVYIHFSGHGNLRRDVQQKYSMAEGGNTLIGAALVTVDALAGQGSYLTAHELGIRIQAMVRKGLRVTLVIDACHSGGGLRQDKLTIRSTESRSDSRDLEDDRANEEKAMAYLASVAKIRHAEVEPDWLSHPFGCTVLTACGIFQEAGEMDFMDNQTGAWTRRGVLTHWMLDLLNRSRSVNFPSYAMVRAHVIERIAGMLSTSDPPRQEPVLNGDADYEFFGDKRHVRRPACRVIDAWDDRVCLDVGRAEGVAIGAVYDVLPPDIDVSDVRSLRHAREARVTKVDEFYCVARLMGVDDTTDGDRPIGSSGVLRTWALRDPVSVEFSAGKYARELLRLELEKTQNLTLHDGAEDSANFTVRTNGEGNFEIWEREYGATESVRLQRLPIISCYDNLALPRLAYVLRHIARYRDIEGLRDLTRARDIWKQDIELFIWRGATRLHAHEVNGLQQFEAIEGQKLSWRLRYRGTATVVYMAFITLNPSWGIAREHHCKLVRNMMEPDEDTRPYGLKMRVPSRCVGTDSLDAHDTVMVFAAEGENEQPWAELSLKDLPCNAQAMRTDEVDMRAYRWRQPEIQLARSLPNRKWSVSTFIIHTSPATGNLGS